MVFAKRGRVHWSPALSKNAPDPFLPARSPLTAYLAAGWWLFAILPGGDEPHYLVITQSLLRDGDIRVENNYAENQYREYFPAGRCVRTLEGPASMERGTRFTLQDCQHSSLPAFALLGYPGVVAFLALIAAAGSAWCCGGRRMPLTGSVAAAWFAWAAGALSVPVLLPGICRLSGRCRRHPRFVCGPSSGRGARQHVPDG